MQQVYFMIFHGIFKFCFAMVTKLDQAALAGSWGGDGRRANASSGFGMSGGTCAVCALHTNCQRVQPLDIAAICSNYQRTCMICNIYNYNIYIYI